MPSGGQDVESQTWSTNKTCLGHISLQKKKRMCDIYVRKCIYIIKKIKAIFEPRTVTVMRKKREN